MLEVEPKAHFAAIEILSLMCWPQLQARNEAMSTFGADAIGAADAYAKNAEQLVQGIFPENIRHRLEAADIKNLDQLRDAHTVTDAATFARAVFQIGNEAKDRLFDASGGFSTVATAPGMDTIIRQVHEAIWQGGAASGLVLIYVARIKMHHKFSASLSRASTILQNLISGQEAIFRGERTHKEDRSAWKSVAPLWAAVLLSGGYPWRQCDLSVSIRDFINGIFDGLMNREALHQTLAYAKWFENFALTHMARNASRPLLLPDELLQYKHRIPAEQPPLMPLNAVELAVAEDHRSYVFKKEAPKR